MTSSWSDCFRSFKIGRQHHEKLIEKDRKEGRKGGRKYKRMNKPGLFFHMYGFCRLIFYSPLPPLNCWHLPHFEGTQSNNITLYFVFAEVCVMNKEADRGSHSTPQSECYYSNMWFGTGCEILFHWRLKENGMLFLIWKHNFWMNNDLPFKTNLLPLLKIREN